MIYNTTQGGVVALENAICPNMVGVDIGCGMLAVKTSLTEITTDQLKAILGGSKENKGGIRANIPLGFDHQKKDVEHPLFNAPLWDETYVCKQELSSLWSWCLERLSRWNVIAKRCTSSCI